LRRGVIGVIGTTLALAFAPAAHCSFPKTSFEHV
jgi:hypothetical protein